MNLNADFNNLLPGETVAVGLSGGIDSVTLLSVLTQNAKRLGVNVVAVNVEHGIRKQASIEDSRFCATLCEKVGVKLYSFSVNAPDHAQRNGCSLEESARILRYDCFFHLLDKGLCDKIALAHHADDQAETILFNILRGSSLQGASGMATADYGGKIIRPLLRVERLDIETFAKENGLEYVVDETNSDVRYTRNALRKNVLPEIERVFPAYRNSLARFADNCRSDDEYLTALAEKSLNAVDGGFAFPVGLAYPIASRCVISALKKLGVQKDYEKSHADAVIALSFSQTGKRVDLPANLYAVRLYDNVVIKAKQADNEVIAPFSLGETPLTEGTISAKLNPEKVAFGDGLYFDLDKLPEGCVFRKKLPGDRFTKFNGQTVSLKKFLTDKKVPADRSNQTFVLAKENIVYLIVDLEISSLIKIDKTTSNIVQLKYFLTKE